MIDCRNHSPQTAAVVCRHMLDAAERCVGFVENSADPDDLQAWCEECEQVFLAEGGLTELFEDFNSRGIVCNDCYARLKARHSRP